MFYILHLLCCTIHFDKYVTKVDEYSISPLNTIKCKMYSKELSYRTNKKKNIHEYQIVFFFVNL